MGVAGVGIAIFIALSLTITWLSGDKARGSLETKITEEEIAQTRLERDLKDARVKAANDSQLLRELERKLNAEIIEKKRLERALDIEESQKRIATQEGGGQAACEKACPDQKAFSQLEEQNKQDIAMLEAKLKAATDAKAQAELSVKELEAFRTSYEQLSKQYAGKGAAVGPASLAQLQHRNKELEAKLKESEEARQSLQEKLAHFDNAFKLAQTSLKNDKFTLENETLNASINKLSKAYDSAKASGLIIDGPSTTSLAETIKETEALLAQARTRRADAEATLANSSDKDMAQIIKDLSLMYAGANREKQDALLTIGLLQTTVKERSKGQVTGLESRLKSLEQNRMGLEGQLSSAMAAIMQLDETAARLESGLGTSSQPVEGILKLQNEIESLRQARENVRLAMENVKSSMQSNMDSETINMRSEINQLSGSLEQIASINKGAGAISLMGQTGLQEEPMNLKGIDDAAILNKKLQGLNLAIESAFQVSPQAQAGQAAQVGGLTTDGTPCVETRADQALKESYIVQRGDSLWKIAAKKKIYGNPYLWPILYKYNLETVYHPDAIKPGYVLSIIRNLNKPEQELAIKKARKHTKDRAKKGYILRLRRELTQDAGTKK